MQLYLDSFGAYLSVRNGMFAVRTKSVGERAFAVRQVQSILLTKGTAMSTDAVLLAAENNITVLLIDANTHFPLAQLGSVRSGSIASIRKNQALFARSAAGHGWAMRQIAAKIGRQRALLAQLCEQVAPPGFAAEVLLADRLMASLQNGLEQWMAPKTWNAAVRDAAAAQLRGQEGTAARIYFQQVSKYVDGRLHLPFSGRQGHPAYDPLNVLLNYLYGMLYTAVHLALLKSGLDPFMGVLHADRYGDAPTLVFDAIEPYRPWADAVALALVSEGSLAASWFESDPNERGLWLSGSGKSAVIEAMLQHLNAPLSYSGRNVRRAAQIDLEAQQLAVFLKEYEEEL